MTSLNKYLSPKNDDGSIDQRYSETTKRLMDMLGPKGLDAVDALRQGQIALTRQHGWVASDICDYMYSLANEMEDKEDHIHRWKSKKLRKAVRSVLEGIGLTSPQVTFIIKAKEFTEKLKFDAYKGRKPKLTLVEQLEFIRTYGPRARYIFSLMDPIGIRKALKTSKNKGGELLSVRELEEIKAENPNHGRPRNPLITIVDDDLSATSEVITLSKYDKARQLRDLAIELDTDDAWKDTEMIEILSSVKQELWQLAHIATLPIKETITI